MRGEYFWGWRYATTTTMLAAYGAQLRIKAAAAVRKRREAILFRQFEPFTGYGYEPDPGRYQLRDYLECLWTCPFFRDLYEEQVAEGGFATFCFMHHEIAPRECEHFSRYRHILFRQFDMED